MAKYIEQEAAMDIFGDVPMWDGYYEPYTWEVHCAIVGIVKLIKEELNKVPAADVAPIRHGHWIRVSLIGVFECSECGNQITVTDSKFAKEVYRWCLHCGARMDGGVNDEVN